MNDIHWVYFGRDGAESPSELWRAPATARSPEQCFAAMQRLHKGLFWLDASDDPALRNDWLTGWFDFDENRLSDEEAAQLIMDWATRDEWPGRP